MPETEQNPENPILVEMASIFGLKIERGEFQQVFLRGTFEYFGGGSQAIADYPIDDTFFERFLKVFRAEELDDIMDGKNCVVKHDNEKIYRISDGIHSFDVEAWRKEVGIEK